MPAGVLGLVLQADLLALATSSGLHPTVILLVQYEGQQQHVTPTMQLSAGHPATTEQWLSRLVLGGVQLRVLLQAATAEAVIQQQKLLSTLDLPASVSVLTTQPRILPVCLRSALRTVHCFC